MSSHTVRLDMDLTMKLLQEIGWVYHTEVNDILLCALGMTLSGWGGHEQVVVWLEGHGREDLAEGIDTSRTVGWFTSLYPVLLEIRKDKGVGDQLKGVKEMLRGIPDKGLGYGVLRYLSGEPKFSGDIKGDIVFNYLGWVDNVVNENKWLKGAGESMGKTIADYNQAMYKLEVNSIVQGGQLLVSWGYSGKHYEKRTIEDLAGSYLKNLELVINGCLKQGKRGPVSTPSDYGLGKEVHYEELDAFMSEVLEGQTRGTRIEGVYRLSGLQEGMLFHGLYDGQVGSYVTQFAAELVNPDLQIFQKSWDLIMERHSILRSGFYHDVFRVPVQCVNREVRMPVEVMDYREMEEEDRQLAVMRMQEDDRLKGFDFKKAPLIRITLIRTSDDRYRMIWTSHHILMDGWSLPVLVEEFLGNYEVLLKGWQVKMGVEDKYEDYIRFLERRDKGREESWWRQYLKGVEGGTLLPFVKWDADRNKGIGIYRKIGLRLNEEITGRVLSYAQRHRLTVNTVMQGVWAMLLHRYTGRRDILYGVTVSGRPEGLPGVEKRVGTYINTLPLRSRLEEGVEVLNWLRALQQEQSESREYQYSMLKSMQEWSGVKGELFDTLLVFENYPVGEAISSQEWSLRVEGVKVVEQTNYPLGVTIAVTNEIQIDLNYNSSVLGTSYVSRIAGHFQEVLLGMMESGGGVQVKDIRLLAKGERECLLGFSGGVVPVKKEETVMDLFEDQVLRCPDAVAVVHEGGVLSYKELDERSNQLGHYLRRKGVREDSLVGICVGRSVEMLVGIWGIWKAGGAYVPLDPGYPKERLDFMLKDTGVPVVLSSEWMKDRLPEIEGLEMVLLDSEWDWISREPVSRPAIQVRADHLAYVIYTSGSTGRPKGVMIEHGSVLNYVDNDQTRYIREGEGTKSGSYVHLSYSFDASVTALSLPLVSGRSVVLGEQGELFGGRMMAEGAPYDFVKVTPGHLPLIKELQEEKGIVMTRRWVLGGEALRLGQMNYLLEGMEGVEVINEYGPTEATVGCSTYWMRKGERLEEGSHGVWIGRPIGGAEIYIGGEGQLSPVGIPGELYIGGAGLARGYLNRPELTAEKFVENGFDRDRGGRLYRSGDLGRWLEGGDIEYLGRRDEQVKVRGYRVELGEVERVLESCPGVSQGVVVARSDGGGVVQLVGYAVSEGTFDRECILSYLQERLPEYMVPSYMIALEKLPLTVNGKVDRKGLPDPDHGAVGTAYGEGPRNRSEEGLVDIWKELLGLEWVGINDNFFAIGGHSLLAIRLISALRKELGVEVSIQAIFDHPTVGTLSVHLQELERGVAIPQIIAGPRPERIPLSYGQERLWFIHQLQGSVQYHVPVVLRLGGAIDIAALSYALCEVVNRHEVLRTVVQEEDGVAYQRVLEKNSWRLEIVEDPVYSSNKGVLEVKIEEWLGQSFDLSKDHMLRVRLVKLAEGEYLLVGVLHHIASDGWSRNILVREFVELYRSHMEGRVAELPVLNVQYADYAIWQRKYLQGDVLERALGYWKDQLDNIGILQLPTDYPRPAIQSTRGATLSFRIEEELTDKLRRLSLQEGATLFMTLLSAFKVLLFRYTGQKDIAVGSITANRSQHEIEGLIGFFVNAFVLRSKVEDDMSFLDLLLQVKYTTIDAYSHQVVPFEKVVEAVVKERDMSRPPLAQVVFDLQNNSQAMIGDDDLYGLQLSPESVVRQSSLFDIGFVMTEGSAGLSGSVEYCVDLYRQATIERMISHYMHVLKAVVDNPSLKLADLSILSEPNMQEVTLLIKDESIDENDLFDFHSFSH